MFKVGDHVNIRNESNSYWAQGNPSVITRLSTDGAHAICSTLGQPDGRGLRDGAFEFSALELVEPLQFCAECERSFNGAADYLCKACRCH